MAGHTSTIRRWGNGQGLLIPRAIMDAAGLTVGEKLNLTVKADGHIVLAPEGRWFEPPRKTTVEELFAGYQGKFEPEEADWGESVGHEEW